jgi:dTDP-6-deoxy-L-talose 4-dehydrogenase (NAD+)
MKIAVTGASGFLGRHVTNELLQRGISPVLATRDPASLASLHPHATIVQLDFHSPPADPFAALGHPDILIHLAWQGLPNYQALHHLELELPAQTRFLKTLVAAGLGTLAVTGTCLEYGTTSGLKTEDDISAPSTAYAVAKDTLRQYLQLLQQIQPFQLIWHRLFYLYGPGQSPTSLLSQLHDAITMGEPSFKMSGGEQIRDFHHVVTAAREIVSLALKQQPFGIVNGCSGNPTSVRSFIERHLAQHGLSMPLDLGHYPYAAYEPFAFWGDVTYLNHCLAQ